MWNAYKSNSACKAAVLVPHNLTFALRWTSNEAKNLLSYVSAVMVDCVGVVFVYFPDQTKHNGSWMKCAEELISFSVEHFESYAL